LIVSSNEKPCSGKTKVGWIPSGAWESGFEGQLPPPGVVSNAVAMAGGDFHSLVLDTFGSVHIWGQYLTPTGLVTAAVPAGLPAVSALAAGAHHDLAVVAGPPDADSAVLSVTAAAGGPWIECSGQPWKNHALEAASTPAGPWSFLWNLGPSETGVQWAVDPGAAGMSWRFYRARRLP